MTELEERLLDAVLADPACHALLHRLPDLGLDEWWLTGGAVFQNVWNALEGKPPGWGIKDYDVFYFDPTDLSWEAEDAVIRRVTTLLADVPAHVEVKNEARVHLWAEEKFGEDVAPLSSAAAAIEGFAATACAVGVTRDDSGPRVHAPFGLEDVFALRMWPNHRVPLRRVYDLKVASYTTRWPSLVCEPW